jgi:MYXO-CTERM domain-containing protein
MLRKRRFAICMLAAVAAGMLGTANVASAAAVRAGFDSILFPGNDDGSVGPVNIGFTVDFFGLNFTQLFVNNNGNVTFDAALGTYTPFDLTSTGRQIIAPFFADVDTRGAGADTMYGAGTVNGRNAFGVSWRNVDYFVTNPGHTNLNTFQLVLIDRADTGAGNFDIEFNYDAIEWESGQASGGDGNGLGGASARAGYSNGTGAPGSFFELAGSAVNGAFLDSSPSGLIHHSLNSNVLGRYVFTARNGTIDPTPHVVPEPASLAIWGLGALGLAAAARRRRKQAA